MSTALPVFAGGAALQGEASHSAHHCSLHIAPRTQRPAFCSLCVEALGPGLPPSAAFRQTLDRVLSDKRGWVVRGPDIALPRITRSLWQRPWRHVRTSSTKVQREKRGSWRVVRGARATALPHLSGYFLVKMPDPSLMCVGGVSFPKTNPSLVNWW